MTVIRTRISNHMSTYLIFLNAYMYAHTYMQYHAYINTQGERGEREREREREKERERERDR